MRIGICDSTGSDNCPSESSTGLAVSLSLDSRDFQTDSNESAVVVIPDVGTQLIKPMSTTEGIESPLIVHSECTRVESKPSLC